ncbi:hypothetical protein WOLCODRAFT_104900 [Wolfiporia cocos MD-104 SS10]|uniref:F-box domain-containing protein n=1 Tax=Wolfiporia cocos (strain MD-104) TaxID=742152 RepID=A0A2H3JZI6_WOLCO|nr:hypothetical protein WOLCODRAFT_104900 [Wolfiporia cocos MD-104 SS10]
MAASERADLPGDSEDLVRFREQWKAEVRKKKLGLSSVDSGPSASVTNAVAVDGSKGTGQPLRTEGSPQAPATRDTTYVSTSVANSSGSTPYSVALTRAVEVYRRAVLAEQQSNLDEALGLYRTAFRMDSNVDRAYHKIEAQFHSVPVQPQTLRKTDKHAVDEIAQAIKALDLHSSFVPAGQNNGAAITGTLANLLAEWPRSLSFAPEDEKEAVPLQKIPYELLLHVLRSLDTTTLERFAKVSRKARVVTLDVSIWRAHVQATYKPPQIEDEEELDVLVHQYVGDHRRLFIEHPRVRMDGVYIAVCHYIRNGLSENTWVNVSHLITYHRYLRFYPNGQVLSLLANEEMPPQQVIPMLKPTLRMKGLYIGTWRLSGAIVYITSLLDPSPPSHSGTRYAFQMTLELKSRPVGRWNRLEFRAYDSVNIESGEATPLVLKHERPFWFSKVRSYIQSSG